MKKFYTSVTTGYNKLHVTGFDGEKRFVKDIPFNPKIYFEDENGEHLTIDEKKVREHEFEDVASYSKYVRENRKLLKLYGDIDPCYQAITKWFPNQIQYTKEHINVVYFDIEVSSLDEDNKYVGFPHATIAPIPIVNVAIFYPLYNEMVTLGLKDFDDIGEFPYKVTYRKCISEEHLIQTLGQYFTSSKYRPDLLYGWNSEDFDIPYIINRAINIGGEKLANKLSPFGKLSQRNTKKKDVSKQFKDAVIHSITGIQHIDMMYAYTIFGGRETKESYSLNFIANQEGVGEKLDYGQSKTIMDFFWEDHQRYVEYNMQDTYLLYLIDNKLSLSDRIISTAYNNHCNYEDTLSTTLPWDVIIYNEATNRGLVIPNKEVKEKEKYDGGFVRDSILGRADWVMTFDYTSLYPSIMMAFNMSYETLLPEYEEGCLVTPNGCFFTKSKQGIIAYLVKKFFAERVYHKNEAKKYINDKDRQDLYEYHDVTQYVKKILINSVYGATGSAFFRYFHTDIAKSITLTGQHLIKNTAKTLNDSMVRLTGVDKDYLVMGDTDSVAISFGDYVKSNCQGMTTREISERLVSIWENDFSLKIREMIEAFYKECNVTEDTIKLNLESIVKSAIYCAKKNYIGHIVYNEGKYYEEGVLKIVNEDDEEMETKIKGVSGVKSSTPLIFRKYLTEFYNVALAGTNLDAIRIIRRAEKEYVKEIMNFFGKPVKVKNLKKYECSKNIFVKGTPSNQRGCLLYNYLIKKHKLEAKYDLIRDGEFAHAIRLSRPLMGSNFIVFPNEIIPPELNLDKYLDFDKMFHDGFTKAVNDIMKLIGWSLTPPKQVNFSLKF